VGEYTYAVTQNTFGGPALMEGYRHPGADESEVGAIILIDHLRWRVRDLQVDVDRTSNNTVVVEPLEANDLERALDSVRDVEDG
jgi:hypothetical protein